MGTIEVPVAEETFTANQVVSIGGMAGLQAVTIPQPATVLVTVKDAAFSSTANLGSAGVYTSPWVSNEQARRISGTAFANQSGSFVIQGSDDGVNWVALGSSTAVTASTLATFDQIIYNALTRVVYTNGATPTTVFRLYGYISEYAG